MPSKSMRSKSKSMRSKSMHMRSMRSKNKNKNKTRRHKKTMSRRQVHSRRHVHSRSCRHSRRRMHGGSGSPPPWVGSPYNAGALNPRGNFLPLSSQGVPSGLPVPPINSNPQFGGGRRRKRGQNGGGFSDNLSTFVSTVLPEDLLNAGRYIPAAAGHLMDRFNGLIPSASSHVYPTQQPMALQTQQARANVLPVDVNAAYTRALSSVQSM